MPARKAPEVTVELVGRYATERTHGERFGDCAARVEPSTLKASLKTFDSMPPLADDPLFYSDWGDSRQFQMGKGECAR